MHINLHRPIKTDFHVAFYLRLPKSNPDVVDVHLIDAFDHRSNRKPLVQDRGWLLG